MRRTTNAGQVLVSLIHKWARRLMPSAALRLGRLCLGWPGLVVIAIALLALVSGIAATQNPNEPTDQWVDDGGTVQVDQTTLTIREGESKSYRLRLNRQPLEDGWWAMILVDGSKRYNGHYDKDGDGEDDISWMPDVGWQIDVTDDMNAGAVTPWRNITITAKQDDDTEDQTITFLLIHESPLTDTLFLLVSKSDEVTTT